MSQNTSHAVMAQRHEAHDSLDHFPTQPWGTRALCEQLLKYIGISPNWSVWEPACGTGDMARPLGEYFQKVVASDVHDYGYGPVRDFLMPYGIEPPIDWVITNPPFRLATQFIERAREIASVGVAMLVRTSFLESVDRYETLFKNSPPTYAMQFVERIPMVKGRLDPKASTATSYCWLVWYRFGKQGARLVWIPPCRKRLERPEDYAVRAA